MPETSGASKRFAGQFIDKGGHGIHIMHPDFGATGDGVVDDTVAVQAWLDAVAASKGKWGIVHGRFRITAPISTTLFSDDYPLKIVGSGGRSTGVGGASGFGATFMLGADLATNDTPMILIDGDQNAAGIIIEDVDFLGQNHVGTGLKILDASHRFEMRGGSILNFAGYGLWTQNCVGHLIHGPHLKNNGTNWRTEGGVSFQCGEGHVCAKFESPTSGRNVLIGVGSAFFSFSGTTFYNGHVELENGVYSIGFHQTSFEASTPALYLPSGKEAYEITVEGCTSNPINNAGSGTVYAFDFAGHLKNSRISHNVISMTANGGATTVAIRVGTASHNTIGPNRFATSGAGTFVRYQLPDIGAALYQPTNDVDVLQGALTAVIQHQVLGYLQVRGAEVSVANDGVLVTDSMFSGVLFIVAGGYVGAFVMSFGVLSEWYDPSGKYTVTKDTASSVNVYKESGVIKIQNKLGATWNVMPIFLGNN